MLEESKYVRQFVSFTGKCPYKCNHCYTFCERYDSYDSGRNVKEVVDSLRNTSFDIVYISGHKENFVDADEGLELCEAIFDNFCTDILVTTRNVFSSKQLNRFEKLSKKMELKKREIFFCASIPAVRSYKKLEPASIIPNPYQRMDNLKNIYDIGIRTFLTLRPLCPNSFVPIEEIFEIMEQCKNHTSVVLSSGIVLDQQILGKLEGFPKDFEWEEKQLMPCLKNSLSMKYVNVEKEIKLIKEKCKQLDLPFFEHSLPAIEFLKKHIDRV